MELIILKFNLEKCCVKACFILTISTQSKMMLYFLYGNEDYFYLKSGNLSELA